MQGSVDVGRLQDLFDVRLDWRDTATVGGLVSAIAGRIPLPGEVVEDEGLRFEVLESTDRKIDKVRICRSSTNQSGPSAPKAQA
jgi:CBS domain containing-hemolysin-like protein